jgi:hypothetical protein
MGFAKNEQLEHDAKIHQAIGLCIGIDAIEECDFHEGSYIDTLSYSDPEEITNIILADNPDALDLFENRNEMTECVRDAMASSVEECSACAKNRNS